MKFDELKEGVNSLLDSVAGGWNRVRESATTALARFRPGERTDLPAKGTVDDTFFMPSMGWAMLGGDVFEDEKRVVVRLEVPGMDKQELDIEVQGNVLVVQGEKRFARESTEGRYRLLQCAYGSFRRTVPLPADVLSDQAKASYKDGILRVELPKALETPPRKMSIQVE